MNLTFSPSLKNHTLRLCLKNGKSVAGKVLSVDPTEVVLTTSEDPEHVIRINRDDVAAYTGTDEVQREPTLPRLCITRCYNMIMRCNGVKKLSFNESNDMKSCPLYNEGCQKNVGDFFALNKTDQVRLLNGLQVGTYPQDKKD